MGVWAEGALTKTGQHTAISHSERKEQFFWPRECDVTLLSAGVLAPVVLGCPVWLPLMADEAVGEVRKATWAEASDVGGAVSTATALIPREWSLFGISSAAGPSWDEQAL